MSPAESARISGDVNLLYRAESGVMVVENVGARMAALFPPGGARPPTRPLAPGAQVVPWRHLLRLGSGAAPPADARWPTLLAAAGAAAARGEGGLPLADLALCDAWPEDGRQVAPIVEKWLALRDGGEALVEIAKKHDGTRSPKVFQFKAHVTAEFRPALPDGPSAIAQACAWLSQNTEWKVVFRRRESEEARERLPVEESVQELTALLGQLSEECRACRMSPASVQGLVKGTVRLWSLVQYGEERPPAPSLGAFGALAARRVRVCAFCKQKKTSDEKGCCAACGLFSAAWEEAPA